MSAARFHSPLVSIVTPTLNQGRFIEATIRSVEGQTYPAIEHIVVDGGSSDDTINVLRRHEHRAGFRWISESDHGMYDALNKGLRMSRGDIVAYLNSDDLLLPWAAEIAAARLTAHPDLGLVYGDALRVDDATRSVGFFFQPPFDPTYLRTIGSFAQPATFWRRTVHERVGEFDAELQFAGDLDFYLRVASTSPIARIDEFLAVMRLHPAMKTQALAQRSRAENAVVRARYGPAPHRLELIRLRQRAWLGRRRLWLSFALAAQRSKGADRRWARFLADGAVTISARRLVLAQLPVVGLHTPAIARTGVDWLAVPSPPYGRGSRDAGFAGSLPS